MEVKDAKTCDTCTHRGSCEGAELGKPACVSYQVGYKKVLLAKRYGYENLQHIIDDIKALKEMAKLGAILSTNSLDVSVIEVPETFLCNDIIFIDQENK